ncbi:hypothetical protein [Candidatus Entotheonella palauensis]|uniref:Uncharacterized protein n=1 Tax=Candidatus Entotheonella gemina TaxID=1429439 RepID=W4M9W3_9BACT|nr:hypothetical protein [Candidatus Entotheonella palauensis]ETX06965.1 MAG: hypothetical protein ETSY2_13950 [Candidatus Entotheonella gemina]
MLGLFASYKIRVFKGERYALLKNPFSLLPALMMTAGSAHDVSELKERKMMARRARKLRIVSHVRTKKVLRGGNGLVYDAFWRWLLIPN